MKKKTKIIVSIIALFLIIVPILSYKIFVYRNYSVSPEEKEMIKETKQTIENAKNVNLTSKEYEGEYLTYTNMKVAQKFGPMLLKSQNNNFNTYKNIKDDIFISIGIEDNNIELLKNIKNDCNLCKNKIERIIKNKKLTSSTDILNYIKEYNFSKNSFFTSISKTKEDYIVYNYIISYIPSISEFIFLEGSYQGYIYCSKSSHNENLRTYEAVIEKNNKNYFINLISSSGSVTLDDFYDLISTVVME